MNKQTRADVTCRGTGTDSSSLPGQITPLSARWRGLGERRKGGKQQIWAKRGEKTPLGEATGARRLRPAPAYSSRTLRAARAGDEWDLLPIKIKPFL